MCFWLRAIADGGWDSGVVYVPDSLERHIFSLNWSTGVGFIYETQSGEFKNIYQFPASNKWVFVGMSFQSNLIYVAGAYGRDVAHDLVSVNVADKKSLGWPNEDTCIVDRFRVFNRDLTEVDFDRLFAEYSEAI